MRPGFLVAVALVLLTGTACEPGVLPPSSDAGVDDDATRPPRAWITRTGILGNLSMTMPQKWSYSTSKKGEFSYYLSLASNSFRDGSFCDRNGALTALSPDGMFVWAWRGANVFRESGPARQRLGQLRLDPRTLASYETLGCRPTYRMIFRVQEKDISVHVAFGEQASQSLKDEVLTALNSTTASS